MDKNIDVPDSAKAVLPYDPEMHAAPPRTFKEARALVGRKGDIVSEMTLSAMPSFMTMMLMTVPEMIILDTMGVGGLATGLTMGCVAILSLPFGVRHWRRSIVESAEAIDAGVLHVAKNRIRKMASESTDPSRLDTFRAVIDLVDKPDDQIDRATLMKLEAVVRGLDEAVHALGPDLERRKEVQDVAEKAIVSIMSEVDVRIDDYAAATEKTIRSLKTICHDVSTTKDLALSAPPSARISRVLAIAGKALASHPDLVDSNGSRIDALVNTHVPRLLALRSAAIETAPVDGLDSVDAVFSKAFESVQCSIEEALSSMHGDAMEALSTEMRFLSLRRGTTPMLTAIEAPHDLGGVAPSFHAA